MAPELERLLFSAVLLATLAGAAKILGALNRRAVRARSHGLGVPGKPTVLYFWSADCASCPAQERQIEEAAHLLAQKGTSLQIRKVDALGEIALARSMNVMTVPTTVLLDEKGKVIAWNPGLRPARTIVAQIDRSNGGSGTQN